MAPLETSILFDRAQTIPDSLRHRDAIGVPLLVDVNLYSGATIDSYQDLVIFRHDGC